MIIGYNDHISVHLHDFPGTHWNCVQIYQTFFKASYFYNEHFRRGHGKNMAHTKWNKKMKTVLKAWERRHAGAFPASV